MDNTFNLISVAADYYYSSFLSHGDETSKLFSLQLAGLCLKAPSE